MAGADGTNARLDRPLPPFNSLSMNSPAPGVIVL